jgi:hypothetical protein
MSLRRKESRMTRLRIPLAILGAVAATAIGINATASADPATSAETKSAPVAAKNCGFDTLRHDAVVRENPDTDSVVRKQKYRGDIITFPCSAPAIVLDIESNVSFVSVECSCATDGVGWIRQSAFH